MAFVFDSSSAMSMTPPSNMPCFVCQTERGTFKCTQCSQAFCTKHVLDHQQTFTDQLNRIIFERDILQQTILDCKDHYQVLMNEIDRWERESIVRIRQTADEVRQQVKTLTERQTMISNKLRHLTEHLCKGRDENVCLESNLRVWKDEMEKLKRHLVIVSSSFTVREDPVKILVKKLYLLPMTPQFVHNETLECASDTVQITNHGRAAVRLKWWDGSSVRGKNEYSLGIHKFRFIISKKKTCFYFHFGITSKSALHSHRFSTLFGWTANDIFNRSREWLSTTSQQITFEVELTIDCDKQTICFLNERTNGMREMNIDINECPLPWHLCFSLNNIGDGVQLLSSLRT